MFDLILFLILISAWYIFWTIWEKRHFKKIIKEEKELREIIVISNRDAKDLDVSWNHLFMSNIVISIDFFKKFISGFVHFFGWEMWSYESLLDRARRDTIVKIKRQALDSWYNAIANLRLETSSISKWANWQIWSVEVLAYATALNLKNN